MRVKHIRKSLAVGFALALLTWGLVQMLKNQTTKAISMPAANPALVSIISVSVIPAASNIRSAGWNPGDRVTIKGRGFTPLHNKIYGTDAQTDTFISEAASENGTEIIFVLPDDFRAPFGTAIKVVNANGSGANIAAGSRVSF